MKVFLLSLLITVLTTAIIAPSARALTICQDSCNSQYYNTVNTMWQTPRPATASPTTYRQQVIAALNTLNQCMAACSTTTTAPPPTAPSSTLPTQTKGKK